MFENSGGGGPRPLPADAHASTHTAVIQKHIFKQKFRPKYA